ncbi:hypothetical protein SAMN04489832_5348 [Micromonospora cremea]|uniref:Uncharacterized protein n=1 Tax=Micromonospora cremea TaxID=709881 RepID=A0A1N6ADR3_9ACTN|nr:hypothetical protein SAMN04489832_5348 [Micromonospora cremea]
MWAEYWAWGEETLALGDIPLLVPTGDTDTGDEIVAHQHRGVFVLPRHDNQVVPCGPMLMDVLDHYEPDTRWQGIQPPQRGSLS